MIEPIAPPLVSIIIPTYNRKDSLLRTLVSLSHQTYPAECFEVIVIDDGSDDSIGDIATSDYPFALRCLRQPNQGATIARNHGAEHSRGQKLIFMDDDIEAAKQTIDILVTDLTLHAQTIVLGTLISPSNALEQTLASHSIDLLQTRCEQVNQRRGTHVHFQHCMTGLLAINRQDFFSLGMFQDPTGGWPNWDDLDFGYRAWLAGFKFWRSADAVARHWDVSATKLRLSAHRWHRASIVAPRLFQKHPGLYEHMTMYHYKSPIVWGKDSKSLIIRKLIRQVAWSRPLLWAMEMAAQFMESYMPESKAFEALSRAVNSGYMYRGFREGVRLDVRDEAH